MKYAIAFLILAIGNLTFGARETLPFNEGGWEFSTDGTHWTPVTLPHTWNAKDGQSANYYRGVGTYRKTFVPPASDKKVFVKFDAANLTAEVFLNGTSVGKHQGGYTAFAFELCPPLLKVGENQITVRVDNSRNPDVPPLRGDFTFFGGLYRNAWLIQTDAIHFSMADGASGVRVVQSSLTRDKATLRIESDIVNQRHEEATVTQVIKLTTGEVFKSTIKLPAGETTMNVQSVEIAAPHRWDGTADPFLYRADVALVNSAGEVADGIGVSFGLRNIRVDATRGLFLNDHPLDLRGVSLHQDWQGLGWAVTDHEREENLKILREMGANAVRAAHYPRAEEELDMYDRAGILVWSENPLVNDITPTDAFQANAVKQLDEMIRQRKNHPSIFVWGIFNEIHEDAGGLISVLNKVAHREDSTRPTTGASDLHPENSINTHTDFIAFNMYFGWYPASAPDAPGFGGDVSDFGSTIDGAHRVFGDKPVGLSEYGGGASAGQHEVPPLRPKTTSNFHPEEWQALIHESYYSQLTNREFIFGDFIWNLFDFASPIRKEGAEIGINDKGLVSYDRKYKKQAFYFYKAHWNPEPMVFLTSKGFSPANPFPIKAYSNLPIVDLVIDGKSIGKRAPREGVIFEWEGLTLSPGPHSVEARATMRTGRVVLDQTTIEMKP